MTPTPANITATTTIESVPAREQAPLSVYIGMGAGILAALLIGLGAAFFLLRRVRALKRHNGQLLGSAAIRSTASMRSTAAMRGPTAMIDSRAPVLPPTPHVGSIRGFAPFKASYGEIIAKGEGEGSLGSSPRSDTETVVGSAVTPVGTGERDSNSIGKAPPIPPRRR